MNPVKHETESFAQYIEVLDRKKDGDTRRTRRMAKDVG